MLTCFIKALHSGLNMCACGSVDVMGVQEAGDASVRVDGYG
ncbi:MAG: hypothetical protein SOH81_09390 [Acetobacter sp.]